MKTRKKKAGDDMVYVVEYVTAGMQDDESPFVEFYEKMDDAKQAMADWAAQRDILSVRIVTATYAETLGRG